MLYDLTNTYFEGEYRGNPDRAYGKSKERRSDCKLMTMGLAVDGEGEARPTVVMDAGIATEENIQRLSEQGYRSIVVNRGKAPFEIEVKRTEYDNEVYLLVWSERRRLKEEAMMSRVEQLLVDRLKHLKAPMC